MPPESFDRYIDCVATLPLEPASMLCDMAMAKWSAYLSLSAFHLRMLGLGDDPAHLRKAQTFEGVARETYRLMQATIKRVADIEGGMAGSLIEIQLRRKAKELQSRALKRAKRRYERVAMIRRNPVARAMACPSPN